jgi:hypothetical protein
MTTMQNGGTGSCTKRFAEKLQLIERPELGSWLRSTEPHPQSGAIGKGVAGKSRTRPKRKYPSQLIV